MLVINKPQRDALLKPRIALLAEQLAPVLSEHWPRKAQELGEGLLVDLRIGVRAALALGLSADRDVAELLNARWALGHGFPDDPAFEWVHRLFADPGLEEGQKVTQLRVQVLGLLRSRARISG